MATVGNPLDNPTAFDTFALDGISPPGLTMLKGGGNRKDKFENQQAPGFAGAFTVFRMEEISAIDYEIVVWTPEHFEKLRSFLDLLNTGRKKRPPKIWKLTDPRVAHNNITDVCVVDVSALQRVGPGKYSLGIAFTEYRKRKPYGGAPKRAKSELEKKVEAQNEENKALRAQLEAAEKAT
jgi:hypothetical protein